MQACDWSTLTSSLISSMLSRSRLIHASSARTDALISAKVGRFALRYLNINFLQDSESVFAHMYIFMLCYVGSGAPDRKLNWT